MKKYISIFVLFLLILISPSTSAKTEGALSKEQKKAFTMQIRQKKQVIRQRTLDIKDIESQFDIIAYEIGKEFERFYTRETVPKEDMVSKVQEKEGEIFSMLVRTGKLDKAIRLEQAKAKSNIDKGNYSQALFNYDNAISLLNKEKLLLKAYSADMQEFIKLIKSMKY